MSAKDDKPEVQKCHHCGHEWEPRVKQPKKCPQCQNPLWKSTRPKRLRPATTSTTASEVVVLTPPTTTTSIVAEAPADASGVGIVTETPLQRARREADERLRRLADGSVD